VELVTAQRLVWGSLAGRDNHPGVRRLRQDRVPLLPGRPDRAGLDKSLTCEERPGSGGGPVANSEGLGALGNAGVRVLQEVGPCIVRFPVSDPAHFAYPLSFRYPGPCVSDVARHWGTYAGPLVALTCACVCVLPSRVCVWHASCVRIACASVRLTRVGSHVGTIVAIACVVPAHACATIRCVV